MDQNIIQANNPTFNGDGNIIVEEKADGAGKTKLLNMASSS